MHSHGLRAVLNRILHKSREILVATLIQLDGTAFFMVLMAILGISIDLQANSPALEWIQQTTPFNEQAWKYAFYIAAILIALVRPGVSFLGTLLVSPAFLLIYYLFRYLLDRHIASGGATSLVLSVIVGWLFVVSVLFYFRSGLTGQLFSKVVEQKITIRQLQAELAKHESATITKEMEAIHANPEPDA